MCANLIAIVEALEEIQAAISGHPYSTTVREWSRRAEAHARVVEGWLRFSQPHDETQEDALLECVLDLHAEVHRRASGHHAIADEVREQDEARRARQVG
jgi:hypothetical protein